MIDSECQERRTVQHDLDDTREIPHSRVPDGEILHATVETLLLLQVGLNVDFFTWAPVN